MTISKEILDELLQGVERPEDLLGDAGLMKELKIQLMERMLGAELTAHLGYEGGKEAPAGQTNRRNGTSSKVLKGQDGEMPVTIPRDRDGSFEPELVKKGQTRIVGMDGKIVGLYAAGLSVRDIRAHLEDVYGLKVSPDLPFVTFALQIHCRAMDQPRHRCRTRRGPRMAKPSAGSDTPDCHLRCAQSEDQGRGQPDFQK